MERQERFPRISRRGSMMRRVDVAVAALLLGLSALVACGDDDTGGRVDAAAAPDGHVADGAAQGDAAQGDAGPRDGAPPAPDAHTGDGGVPCQGRLLDTVGSPTTVPSPGGAEPAAGAPFVIPETGVQVVRISDAADPQATASDYTNGYSRFSPANITGEYVTAFGSDGRSVIYRLSDRTIVRVLDVGEPNELHWDASGAAGSQTRIYYRTGAVLHRVDVLTGTDDVVHDFAVEYPGAQVAINGVEGAPSLDMRYWAFQICGGMTGGGQCTGLQDIVVYDLQTDAVVGRLSDQESSIPTPNFVDMSPSGARIVVGSCKENGSTPEPWNGPYAWSRDFTSRVRLGTNCTHSGWAWGLGGEELYVSADSCGASNEEITRTCDHLMAVDVNDPQGWDGRVGILPQADLGWGNGVHIGRIYDDRVRGWFFVSTYGDGGNAWTHQLFMVEILPAASGPRIWRIAPTIMADGGYWTEAFASLDFAAQHVYWGSNWDGSANLELYQARLCDGWWAAGP